MSKDASRLNRALFILLVLFPSLFLHKPAATADDSFTLDVHSDKTLAVPPLSNGRPRAGKRVAITPIEYEGGEIFHVIYLPEQWKPDGEKLPIIFEYTGNYSTSLGSSGEPQDAALGYGLSGGKWIWVSLPFVSKDHTKNTKVWWGDKDATIAYAKKNVPRIISDFGANPNAVFLSGFSRGAIAVNYIGLHDDEISDLWTAFIAHDHFDGLKEWPRSWGNPLKDYRKGALERMERIGRRPYLVSFKTRNKDTQNYIESVLPNSKNFTYTYVDIRKLFWSASERARSHEPY